MVIVGLRLYCIGWHSRQIWTLQKFLYIADSKVHRIPNKPKNKEELFHKLKEEWNNLDNKFLQKSVHSAPEQCQAVIEAKYYLMKY